MSLFYLFFFLFDSKLTIYYQNTRGLRSKLHHLYRNILSEDYDIISITETWLIESILDTEICDNRYEVFRLDRDRSLRGKQDGGGVMVLVRRKLEARARPEWSQAGVECLWVTIPANGLRMHSGNADPLATKHDLHLCTIYVPPDTRSSKTLAIDLRHIDSLLIRALSESPNAHFIITGDFNMPNISWCPDGHTTQLHQGSVEIQAASASILETFSAWNLQQLNFF